MIYVTDVMLTTIYSSFLSYSLTPWTGICAQWTHGTEVQKDSACKLLKKTPSFLWKSK